MRESFFRGRDVFIGKFDNENIPGFPKDIWYTDLRRKTPEEYAKILSSAIEARRRIDQDNVFLLFAKNEFKKAIDYINNFSVEKLIYEDKVFATYSLACAKARMSERDRENKGSLLSEALAHISECFSLVGNVRPEFLQELQNQANVDDDLFALRKYRYQEMGDILHKTRINARRTGQDHFKSRGCLDPNTLIETPGGQVAIKDLDIGSEVFCLSPEPPHILKNTFVTHRRMHPCQKRYAINSRLVASSSQPIYVRGIGWRNTEELQLGMELLKSNGTFEALISLDELPPGTVIIIGVEDQLHTFIANEFACHNISK